MRSLDNAVWKLSIPILLAAATYFVSSAYAHAIVLSATPGIHQTIRGPDVPVKLRFNSRIDPKRSRLTLIASGGKEAALGIAGESSGDSLVSEAKGLKSGPYVLRWQVLAVDGHITRGEVPFQVE